VHVFDTYTCASLVVLRGHNGKVGSLPHRSQHASSRSTAAVLRFDSACCIPH